MEADVTYLCQECSLEAGVTHLCRECSLEADVTHLCQECSLEADVIQLLKQETTKGEDHVESLSGVALRKVWEEVILQHRLSLAVVGKSETVLAVVVNVDPGDRPPMQKVSVRFKENIIKYFTDLILNKLINFPAIKVLNCVII